MKRRWLVWLSPLLVMSLFWAGFLIFGRRGRTDSAWPRVVLIGLDGVGWNILNPLLNENALPHIQSLLDLGSSGTLETIAPTKSSVIWTSVATGKTMVKHGIVDWTYVDKHNIVVPYRQSERLAKAFWNILNDEGRTVGVANWFVTFPPDRVRDFMVSDAFYGLKRSDFNKSQATYPPALQKLLRQFLFFDTSNIFDQENVPDYRRWKISGSGGDPLNLIPFFPRFFFQEEAVKRVSRYLFENFRVETFATYYRLIDVASHFAATFIDSGLIEKAHEEEAKTARLSAATEQALDLAFSQIVKPIYVFEDQALGELLQRASAQTTFIICSDHSFYYHQKSYNHIEEPRLAHGIILMKGPSIKKSYKIQKAQIYDVLPTILYLLDLPIAEDLDGRVLTEVFDDAFLRRNPIRSIKTYEGKAPRLEKTRDRMLDKRLLEELKALGYIK